MIADHTKANDDLRKIAEAANVKTSDRLIGEAKTAYDKLEKLSGPEFDHAYISDMVKDHEQVAPEYKKEQSIAKNADLKAYVDQTLPVVQSHLSMAQEIQKTATNG
jgi:putative membrane protein